MLFFDSIQQSFKQSKIENIIERKWDIFLDSIDKKGENKIEQRLEIVEIFIKKYGFDLIVNLPYGYSFPRFRELLPILELVYKGDVIAELSKSKSSVYLRCHLEGCDIDTKNLIKFKWYKHFFSGQTFRNHFGETFKIESVYEINNPNKKEEIIGYKLMISIPEGLKYDDLIKEEPSLSKIIGKTFMTWNDECNKVEVEVITKLLDNKELFRIVKCNPYELYVATTYSYKNVLLNFKTNSNCIFGGINGSGKSVAELMAFINLACQYTKDDFKMYVSFVSYKADLRLLSKLPQCDYYGTTLKESLKVMKYLVKETERRNKIFEQCDKFTTNIFEYNKNHKSNKLPYLYFISDEITDFMVETGDSESVKGIKQEFMSLFNKLSRTGRSAGVWIVVATQRASRDNIPPALKAQLNCVVCFKQINTSSAMTLFGNGESNANRVTRLSKDNRECLIENQDGIIFAKSLYCTNDMMENFIKDIIVDKPKYIELDGNGEIIQENKENIEEINKNNQKIYKKPPKHKRSSSNSWIKEKQEVKND